MQTINKDKIAEALKQNLGVSKLLCNAVVDSTFAEILNIITSGNDLTVTNFGKFSINHKKARPGINFHTKAVVRIPAKQIIRFVASKYLKQMINNND